MIAASAFSSCAEPNSQLHALKVIIIRPKRCIALASIGFTQRAQRTAFTRPAITPPKVNRFGWNLEFCEPNIGGWPWQTLGVIRAVTTVWEGAEIVFIFCSGNQRTISPISRRTIFTNFAHNNVDQMSRRKLSEQNFENFIIMGRFSKKMQKCRKFSISDDFRSPELRNDNRSPLNHGQNKSLRDF